MAKVEVEEETSAVTRAGGLAGRLFTPLATYLRETRAELRKVTWPTRQEWVNLTLLVLGVMIFMSFVLGGLDLLYSRLLDLLFQLVSGAA